MKAIQPGKPLNLQPNDKPKKNYFIRIELDQALPCYYHHALILRHCYNGVKIDKMDQFIGDLHVLFEFNIRTIIPNSNAVMIFQTAGYFCRSIRNLDVYTFLGSGKRPDMWGYATDKAHSAVRVLASELFDLGCNQRIILDEGENVIEISRIANSYISLILSDSTLKDKLDKYTIAALKLWIVLTKIALNMKSILQSGSIPHPLLINIVDCIRVILSSPVSFLIPLADDMDEISYFSEIIPDSSLGGHSYMPKY